MEFLAIIAGIMKIIEVAVPAIEECMNDRLEMAAASLPPADTFASEGAAAAALIDKAIQMTPRRRFFVRYALEEMRDTVVEGDNLRTRPLSDREVRKARRLVGAAVRSIDD